MCTVEDRSRIARAALGLACPEFVNASAVDVE
jgi:hypothetical protein